MPNTLAHLGINALVTRSFIKKADFTLIYIGSVIPDFPWIIQRLVSAIKPSINHYDLRLYSVVLASLFLSLILSFALANLFKDTKRAFIIFSSGSLIHLLLDSIETKWGNGVHFLAPFNWEISNFGFFWPEEIIIYCVTGFGLMYLIFNWRDTISTVSVISIKGQKNFAMFVICFIVYFSLPLLFISSAESANNHFVQTLRNEAHRAGKYFEIDRGYYVDSLTHDKFITPFNEDLKVINLNLNSSESMSVRAKFISNYEIQIIEYHIHHNRDLFSYFGLFILLILLIVFIFKNNSLRTQS